MTKQEKIQEVYGELWNEVVPDENGWIDFDKLPDNLELSGFEAKQYSEPENNYKTTLLRPKSIQGIENNNGWIKIESEDDLPKSNLDCWFENNQGMFRGYYNKKQNFFYDEKYEVIRYEVTHYQPITKPEPHLY